MLADSTPIHGQIMTNFSSIHPRLPSLLFLRKKEPSWPSRLSNRSTGQSRFSKHNDCSLQQCASSCDYHARSDKQITVCTVNAEHPSKNQDTLLGNRQGTAEKTVGK